MSTIGYATLQIIPSIEGLANAVSTQVGAPLVSAGKKAGADMGKAVGDGLASAKAAVESASQKLADARRKEMDAADKVGVAEAKLQTLRDKGVTDAGRLAAAEAAVAKAKRDSEAVTSKAATAATQLTRAEEAATTASKNLGSASSSTSTQVSDLSSSTDKAESSLGKFSKIAAAGAGLAFLGTKVVDVGKSFLDIGETFAGVNKTLQFTTGATGEKLDSMMESVKNIGKGSPKAFGEIADVLAKVSQRTGLTGGDLELLTKQVMKVNAVMGQDTDINGLTAAFAAFGVQGKDASAAMDELFKASRATGVSVNELAAQAVKGAPQFQQFGMSIGESASLMGSLDKAGINSDAVLTGLNKAMISFAKDGRAPKEALHETIGAIQDFTKAGNDAGALELAGKLFGTKGAGQFVNAVKSGAVTVEGLTAAMDENQKGVMAAGGAVPTLSSAWAMFKNNAIIAIEPAATRVFGIFIDGLTWFRTTGVEAIQSVVGAFTGLLTGSGALSIVGDTFSRVKDGAVGLFDLFTKGDFTGALGRAFNIEEDSPIVDKLFRIRDGAIEAFDEVKGGITAFTAAFRDGGNEVTSSGFAGFLEQLGIYARDIADVFTTRIQPALETFGGVVVDVGSVALPLMFDAVVLLKDILIGLGEAVFGVVNFFKDHEVAAGILASVITVGLLPALVTMTTGFITSAGSAVASGFTITGVWISTQASAVASAATQVAAQYRTVAGWVATAASALTSGAIIVGQYVAAGASATLQAGISAAAWVASSARTVGALAAQGAAFIAQKIAMGAGAIATGIMTAAQWALNAAMSANPIGLIVVALGALVAAVVVAYQNSETFRNIVQAAWQGIQDVISFAWNNVVQPVLGFFADRIREVGTVVTFFYDNVVKPYFELVGTVISTVVDGAKSAFGSFTDALGRVGSFFSDTVNGIQSTWASLRGHLAKPINFMIATVWNDGILKAWNAVADFLPGLSPAAPLAGIPEHATGGRISGPGTGTSDDVLMWGSNNEHMLTAREVQLAGGHNAVYAIRDMIMRGVPFSWDGGQIIRDLGQDNVNAYGAQVASKGVGNVDPQGMFDWILPKYKDGGEIRPAWESQLENGHRAAKMRNGNPYTWGHEDCSGYMSMIADAIINGGDGVRRWATGSFPGGQPFVPGLGKGFSVGVHDNPGGPGGGHTAGTLTGVGPYSTVNVESGGSHGNVAYGGPAVGADSGQFAGVSPGQYHLAIGADGAFESGGGGGGPSPQQKQEFLQRKIAEIFDKGLNPIKDSIAGAIGSPPPSMLGIPPKFLDTGRDKVSGFLAEKALGLGELLSSAWDKAKDLGSKLTFGLFDQGGLASGTGFMPKNVIAPERVLSPAETKAWELLVPHLVSLAPALEHFESVVTSPAFTSAANLVQDGQFTPALRDSFGVEEDSPIVNAVLGVRDQLKGIVPDLFDAAPPVTGDSATAADTFGAAEPSAATEPAEPVGGAGVASSYGEGAEGNPEADKWAEWAQNAGKQWEDYFKDNWKEMLNTAVGVGLGGRGGSGDTFNINGSNDTEIARVIQRNQRRKSLAQQRSGGFGRG